MDELRFDGRVAVVTGAGGNPGLGRAYAMLLADRGACVVVNDIGQHADDRGYSDMASAEKVVDEICSRGGRAVADNHSVADKEDAEAIIRSAIDAFGRLDIVVNNAGVSIAAPFDVMTTRDFRRHIDINLMGAYYMCLAAWPYMKVNRFGRIVNITSDSMTGFKNQVAYAASKGGVWSLTRALAAEGSSFGVKVNAVSPGAYTRMVTSLIDERSPFLEYTKEQLPAEIVAPAVGYLCHEGCVVTGECIDSAGGNVQRTYISRTKGISYPGLSIETVAQRWREIVAEDGASTVGVGNFDTDEWRLKPYARED